MKGILAESEGAEQLPPLRAEVAQITAEIASVGEAPNIIELHPTAIRDYLRSVDELEVAMSRDDGSMHPAAESIRALIDRVIGTPEAGGPRLRVEGKLDAIIGGGQFPAMGLGVISGSGGAIPAIPPSALLPFAFEATASRQASLSSSEEGSSPPVDASTA